MLGLETVFESLPQYLAVCLCVLAAETVYVLFGFGAGLIAVGSLAVILPGVQDVVVLLLLVSTPPELFVVWRSRRRITWRGVLAIGLGLAAGVPLGTWILRRGEPAFVLTLLALFLIVVGALFLAVPGRRTVRWPAWTPPATGLLAGVLSGIFGTGGPPLIFYYQLGGAEKAVFRGNLMAIFLLMTLVRVPSYAVAGLLTAPRLVSAAALLPAVALAAWLGNRIHLSLSERTFRRLVSGALVIIGIVLLLRRQV
jgi:uncharacterized membrane protein YfcA